MESNRTKEGSPDPKMLRPLMRVYFVSRELSTVLCGVGERGFGFISPDLYSNSNRRK